MLSSFGGEGCTEELGGIATVAVFFLDEALFAGASGCTTLKWVGPAFRDPGGHRIGGGGAYHEVVHKVAVFSSTTLSAVLFRDSQAFRCRKPRAVGPRANPVLGWRCRCWN